MIKEADLREAIAECQGERNPNANTCIKLAAYYTILNNLEVPRMSYASEPADVVRYDSGTEFSEAIKYKNMYEVLSVVDDLMDSVQVLIPKLYEATMDKIKTIM